MSAGPSRGGSRHRLLRFGTGSAWSVHQMGLAAVSALGGLLYFIALHQASGGFDPSWWVLMPVPALLLGLNASGAPLAYWALMFVGWVHLTPTGSFTWWSVLAALGVLLGHVGAALSATAPPAALFPGRVVQRWLRVTLVALTATVAVAVSTGLLRGHVDGWAALAQILALLGLGAGVWLLRSTGPADAG